MAKKAENKTYEYFRVDEAFFNGKYKDYVDKLWVQNKIQESYFKRLVDLYAFAAIAGFIMNRREPDDPNADSNDKRTVQLMQITDTYYTLMPIMRIILMLDESRGLSAEDRVNSAFRTPETKEEYEANMELFNSYVRGGVSYLYEQLVIRKPDDNDEHDDARLNNILALLKETVPNSNDIG